MVSGGSAAEALESVDAVLDDVAPTVDLAVGRRRGVVVGATRSRMKVVRVLILPDDGADTRRG